jgi:hypothetical protein
VAMLEHEADRFTQALDDHEWVSGVDLEVVA